MLSIIPKTNIVSKWRVYSNFHKHIRYLVNQTNVNYLDKTISRNLNFNYICNVDFSTKISEEVQIELSKRTYEKVCEETLESLTIFFEELIAEENKLAKADVTYGGGVLTIDLAEYGTYVINKQTPNKQIWLSSPISGPKRYDYSSQTDSWIYKHDGNTLHGLLITEFETLLGKKLEIKCHHCGV